MGKTGETGNSDKLGEIGESGEPCKSGEIGESGSLQLSLQLVSSLIRVTKYYIVRSSNHHSMTLSLTGTDSDILTSLLNSAFLSHSESSLIVVLPLYHPTCGNIWSKTFLCFLSSFTSAGNHQRKEN